MGEIGTNVAYLTIANIALTWLCEKFGIISKNFATKIFDYCKKELVFDILYYVVTFIIVRKQFQGIAAIQKMQEVFHPVVSTAINFVALNLIWCVPFTMSRIKKYLVLWFR